MTDDEKRKAAREAGYSDADIDAFLSTKKAVKSPPVAAPEPVAQQATLLQKMMNAATGNQLGTSESSSVNTLKPKMEAMADAVGSQMANPAGAALIRAMANPRSTAAMVPRYGGALLSAEGGPTGAMFSGGGEALAQKISGESDPRAVAVSTAMGAVPLVGATKVLSGANLGNAAKLGAVNYGVNKIADKVAEAMGVPEQANSSEKQAALVTGVSAMSPLLGKMLGKLMGNVAPEEIARIESLKLNNANKDAALAALPGATVVPSSVNPSMKNKILESVAGIQNLEGGVARENQPMFNEIGRAEAHIPADKAINEQSLSDARSLIGQTSYDAARNAGFGDQLNNWRDAGTKLKQAQKELNKGFTNARGKAVDDAEKALVRAENAMNRAAQHPDAAKILGEAKTAFAKNYDVGEAVAGGTDEVRPAILSEMLRQRGEEGLSGGLLDIAKFNNAFGRSAKNPNKMATAPGAASAGAALVAGAGNPVQTAALTGGVPMVRESIRDLLTSRAYQAKNAVRNYTPRTSADPEITKLLTRLGSTAGSNDNLAEMVRLWQMQQALQNQ